MSDSLPIVKIPFSFVNPEFKPGGLDYYLKPVLVDAVVLQLNLSTGTMRVRLLEKVRGPHDDKAKFVTTDTSIQYFYAAHEINPKV